MLKIFKDTEFGVLCTEMQLQGDVPTDMLFMSDHIEVYQLRVVSLLNYERYKISVGNNYILLEQFADKTMKNLFQFTDMKIGELLSFYCGKTK